MKNQGNIPSQKENNVSNYYAQRHEFCNLADKESKIVILMKLKKASRKLRKTIQWNLKKKYMITMRYLFSRDGNHIKEANKDPGAKELNEWSKKCKKEQLQ